MTQIELIFAGFICDHLLNLRVQYASAFYYSS